MKQKIKLFIKTQYLFSMMQKSINSIENNRLSKVYILFENFNSFQSYVVTHIREKPLPVGCFVSFALINSLRHRQKSEPQTDVAKYMRRDTIPLVSSSLQGNLFS